MPLNTAFPELSRLTKALTTLPDEAAKVSSTLIATCAALFPPTVTTLLAAGVPLTSPDKFAAAICATTEAALTGA